MCRKVKDKSRSFGDANNTIVWIFGAQYFYVLIHLCRIFFSKLLNCIGIKAKASALQQHNSNACIGLHNAPIHTAAAAYIRAVRSSFRLWGGGAESEGRRPEEIFKFRVSERPFPGLWGRFDRILMVRKQRFSMSKFTI
jgi:hypothetical protein